jgi:hypothetical protein
VDQERWENLKRSLKSDMKSITGKLERDKGFTTVKPGLDDYDGCFSAWWLEDLRRMPNGLLVVTIAEDEDATEAGITKYRSRLTTLAQKNFLHGESKTVTFKVLRPPSAALTAVTLLDLVLTPKSAQAARNQWDEVKDEIKFRIERLSDPARSAQLDYFRQAVEPVKLLSIEMDGDKPVWKLQAPSAKKTQAVFSLLRAHVHGSIRKVAGSEVQILVVDFGA